jgi:hypothetical protein
VHQPWPRFLDPWEQLQSGFDQQYGRSLVSIRRPWSPHVEPSTQFDRKDAEPHVQEADIPPTVSDHHGDHGGIGRQRSPKKTLLTENKKKAPRVQVDSAASSQAPDFEVPDRRVDLVYDPSQACKDMSIRLEFDAEDDWEADLEAFCRLRRLGRFKEAKESFRSKLEHVSTIPYIRVQYAEMLEACGDYKALQNLISRREFSRDPSEEAPDDRNRGKLAANDALLECLSQRPNPAYIETAWRVVDHTVKALATETTMGSTEVGHEYPACYLAAHLTSRESDPAAFFMPARSELY